MNVPVLTFFNNKGGVGKTSLIYHLAWMYSMLGKKVLIADLDPQANLTAAFLTEEEIEYLWKEQRPGSTIYRCVEPLAGVGDIVKPELQEIDTDLFLVPGDVKLSGFEDMLSDEWPGSMGDNNLYRPMRILSAFWQVMQMGADERAVDMILVDIGPNLGAINRSVLIATDFVVIPLGADLFSLQGLKHLGPTLRSWKNLWNKRIDNWQNSKESSDQGCFSLPGAKMQPVGYVCQQYSVHLARPVKAYDKWVCQIPQVYRKAVLKKPDPVSIKTEDDPFCLATIRHYRSLIPMGQEYRKPIFKLTPADGAIGAHAGAVRDAENDFRALAEKISGKIQEDFG